MTALLRLLILALTMALFLVLEALSLFLLLGSLSNPLTASQRELQIGVTTVALTALVLVVASLKTGFWQKLASRPPIGSTGQ